KVVQQNASNSEESASAAEEMNGQAEQMKEYVGQLLALVNGANPELLEARSHGKYHSPEPVVSPPGKPLMTPPKPRKELHRHSLGKKVKPNQIIPLGEDDFKEF
ncbi:MAG: hypothetical protein NTY64_13940, partial [Deltaproteobacteria bacterium]|nr:hypothetical protein [Deltaproteobacteria bacterium]